MCNYSDPTVPQEPSGGWPWQAPHSHISTPQHRQVVQGSAGTQDTALGAPRDQEHCCHHALGPRLTCFAIALLNVANAVFSCWCLLCKMPYSALSLPTALRGTRKMPLDSPIFFS